MKETLGAPAAESGNDSWSMLSALADKYDASQRQRIDQIKAEKGYDAVAPVRAEITPTKAQKIGRILIEMAGLKLKSVEARRNEEAFISAQNELRANIQRTLAENDERERMEQEARRKAEAEAQAEAARLDQAELEQEMADARDVFDRRRNERLRNQRAQELLERDLNSKLLTVDRLEEEVWSENPEVEKSSMSYEGEEIPVYTLRGLPYRMLTHTVDYRKANKPGEIGTETYRAVMEDPSIWDQRRDSAEQSEGFGTRNGNARGDTISTSFTNSERNFDSRVSGELVYGFGGVEADSVISVTNGDGGTSNMAGNGETAISDPGQMSVLEGAQSTRIYNEVLLRRYSENGMPKRPDFLVVEDGKITEAVLKHAKYFGIPIVNLDTRSYYDKSFERGKAVIDSISENDSFEEINKKVEEIKQNYTVKSAYTDLTRIGRSGDIPAGVYLNETYEKCAAAAKIEFAKRLEYIGETLEKYIAAIREATARGERAASLPEGLDEFSVNVRDVQNDKWRTVVSDSKGYMQAPGGCNSIGVSMRLSGSSRRVETSVFDGKHPFEVDTALQRGIITQEKLAQADSSYYEKLMPLVEEYFRAWRENRGI